MYTQAEKTKVPQVVGSIARKSSESTQSKVKSQTSGCSDLQFQVLQKAKGSHGKDLLLNVKGTYRIGDNPVVTFNDRGEKVSIVKGHGGYTDEDALAEAWVRTAYGLPKDAVVVIEKYNFYTAKS